MECPICSFENAKLVPSMYGDFISCERCHSMVLEVYSAEIRSKFGRLQEFEEFELKEAARKKAQYNLEQQKLRKNT